MNAKNIVLLNRVKKHTSVFFRTPSHPSTVSHDGFEVFFYLFMQFRRVKIVYLVRDPRATLNSRTAFGWCTKSRDCMEPKRLCDDIDRDLDAFGQLSKVYSDRLMLVKYETLATEPFKTFGSIFHFACLSFTPSVRETIRLHTSRNKNGAASTFRKSSERIDLWTRKLGWLKIRRIQSVCSSVLKRLEYQILWSMAVNESTVKLF